MLYIIWKLWPRPCHPIPKEPIRLVLNPCNWSPNTYHAFLSGKSTNLDMGCYIFWRAILGRFHIASSMDQNSCAPRRPAGKTGSSLLSPSLLCFKTPVSENFCFSSLPSYWHVLSIFITHGWASSRPTDRPTDRPTLPWIALLALSHGIEFVSSSVKSQFLED